MPDPPNKSGILTREPPTIRASAVLIDAMPVALQTLLLHTASNIFMTLGWYTRT